MVGWFSTSRKSALFRWASRSGSPVQSPRASISTLTEEFFGFAGSNSSVPCTLLKCPRTQVTIMCRAQNSAAVCPGSKNHLAMTRLLSTGRALRSALPFGHEKENGADRRDREGDPAPRVGRVALAALLFRERGLHPALHTLVAAALAGRDEEAHDAEQDEDESDTSHESSFGGILAVLTRARRSGRGPRPGPLRTGSS